VLGIYPLGVYDNFFELGGDSIKAVRLFGEIEQTFGQNLPLVTLFQTATIEGLASIIGREEESASWSSLVPIQPNGSKLPLFCLHGAGGNVLVFRDLARHLGEEQPFYGLQSRGLNGQEFPLTTVEDMARCYLEEIKTVQPTGSYLLAGYCLGSKVALEMAQLLRAEGEEVALLALLEPDPIRFSTQMSRLASERSYRDRFKDLHYRLVTMGIVYLLKQQFLKVMSKLYQSLGLSLPQSVQIIKVEEINVQASRKYVAPQTYPGKVSIFLTSEQTAKFAASQQSWTEIISGELEIHEVPGRHEDTLPDSFLKEPYVKVLAEKLKEKVRLVPSRSF
jgi:thioesterase domain-containing protein/aryl carrier-like protein